MPVFVAHTKREGKKENKRKEKKCHVCNKEPYLQAHLLPSPPPLSEWTAAFWLAAGSASLSLHLVFFLPPICSGLAVTAGGKCAAFLTGALKNAERVGEDGDLPQCPGSQPRASPQTDELKFKPSVFPLLPSGHQRRWSVFRRSQKLCVNTKH